jgi:hypothetical protein
MYAMDMHISIVSDLAEIFRRLGHTVDVDSLSNHAWVLGKQKAKVRGLRAPLESKLGGLLRDVRDIDQRMCDRFYKENKAHLDQYDAFIVSYPPAFSLLFERFNKPIIVVSCTRFDFPCMNPERLDWLIRGLNRLWDKKLLVPIANNLLDQALLQENTNMDWKFIPSLTNYMTNTYAPSKSTFALWFRGDASLSQKLRSVEDVDPVFDITVKYDRATIRNFRGVVHIPYQVSIMSAFEHYAQGIPMFFPAQQLIHEWMESGFNVLSEALFPGSQLKLPTHYYEYSDFYDQDNFAYIQYFSNLDELRERMQTTNFSQVSHQMLAHHKVRTDRAVREWSQLLQELS